MINYASNCFFTSKLSFIAFSNPSNPSLTYSAAFFRNWSAYSYSTYSTTRVLKTNANWYSWNSLDSTICDQCYSTSFIVLESGQFTFEVEDVNTCLNSDTTQVIIDGSLYVPNAFSPDGDGINEIFDVQGEQIVSYLLQVFDRWGLLLFESDDLSKKWDGTYKGEGVQMDTYVWKVKYMDTHRDSYEKVGHVTVVR